MAEETKRASSETVVEGKTVRILGKTTIDSVSELVGEAQRGGGRAIVLTASDVLLSNKTAAQKPSRTATDKKNIALSHGASDKLIVNRGGGFAGGVTIEGEVTLTGQATVEQIAAQAVSAKVLRGWGKTDRMDVECKMTFGDAVELGKGATVTGPVEVKPATKTGKGSLTIRHNAILVDVPRKSKPLDLVAEVIALRRELEALQEKVARLERRKDS